MLTAVNIYKKRLLHQCFSAGGSRPTFGRQYFYRHFVLYSVLLLPNAENRCSAYCTSSLLIKALTNECRKFFRPKKLSRLFVRIVCNMKTSTYVVLWFASGSLWSSATRTFEIRHWWGPISENRRTSDRRQKQSDLGQLQVIFVTNLYLVTSQKKLSRSA